MGKLMNMLLLSCRKATELMEKRLHVKLSPVEKAQLAMHIRVCRTCKGYDGQSKFLDSALKANQDVNREADVGDMDGLKSKIINRLKEG